MKKKLTDKLTFSVVLASVHATMRKEEQIENIVYELTQTQDNYKITYSCNNNGRNEKEKEVILCETKLREVAIKMFAEIATNDIKEIYIINTNQIK